MEDKLTILCIADDDQESNKYISFNIPLTFKYRQQICIKNKTKQQCLDDISYEGTHILQKNKTAAFPSLSSFGNGLSKSSTNVSVKLYIYFLSTTLFDGHHNLVSLSPWHPSASRTPLSRTLFHQRSSKLCTQKLDRLLPSWFSSLIFSGFRSSEMNWQ